MIETSTEPELSLGSFRGRLTKKLSAEDSRIRSPSSAGSKQRPRRWTPFCWDKLSETTQRQISDSLEAGAPDAAVARRAGRGSERASSARHARSADPCHAGTARGHRRSLRSARGGAGAADVLLLRRAGAGRRRNGGPRRSKRNLSSAPNNSARRAGWPPRSRIRSRIRSPSSTTSPFPCKRTSQPAQPEAAQQLEIIREEIAKADRIITQVMGYAQLSEGRVEKLNVIEELNRAIEEVFPARRADGRRRFSRSSPARSPAVADAATAFYRRRGQSAAKRPRCGGRPAATSTSGRAASAITRSRSRCATTARAFRPDKLGTDF